MIVKLNARTVDSVKPTGKRAEYHDTEVRGLTLRVTARGAKSWSVLYRHRGRLRRLTLGDADVISLADARKRAKDELNKVSKGDDPAAAKQEDRRAETIADLVDEYIEKHAKRKKRSWREDLRILNSSVLPTWKHRAIVDVKRRDVRELLDGIAARAPIMANRVLACVRKMFSFAVDRELIESNPAARMARPGNEQARSRVLSENEIRQLWEAFDELPAEMAAFYKLRLVTAQRSKEVSAMRWSDAELSTGWWTIPAGVSKNKLAHRVPLASTAVTILKALREEADASAVYALAGARGRRQQSEAAATFPVGDFRGHDLRRTAASLMTGGGVPRLTVGKILNHVETGVTAVYDRHSYDTEKRAALTWWNTKLTAILAGGDGAKVLPFRREA